MPYDPNTDIWSSYDFLQVHPLIFNDTLIIPLVLPLVDNTLHVPLCQVHKVWMLSTMFHKTLAIPMTNSYLAITLGWKILYLHSKHGQFKVFHFKRTLLLSVSRPIFHTRTYKLCPGSLFQPWNCHWFILFHYSPYHHKKINYPI